MNDMYPFLPFRNSKRKEIDKLSEDLKNEFDPLYIETLANQYRNDLLKFRWRVRLSKFGAWLVSLGRRIQHRSHLPFEVSHTKWRTVALQSVKIRRRH